MRATGRPVLRVLLACLTAGVLNVLVPEPFANTAKAEADQEQCTCNISISGAGKTGSKTVNAAACVRHQFQNWCEIFVAALENTREQHNLVVAVIAMGAQGVTPAPLFMALFDNYAKSATGATPEMMNRLQGDRKLLEARVNDRENVQLFTNCARDFATKEKNVNYRTDTFSCSVGEVSKWLAVSFKVEDGVYTYLFAPPS